MIIHLEPLNTSRKIDIALKMSWNYYKDLRVYGECALCNVEFVYYIITSWRFPGYLKLFSLFTRTWSILPGNKIFALKADPLNLESQNQAKNIPVVPPSSPIKVWGRSDK